MTKGFTYSVQATEEEFNLFKGIKVRYNWLGEEYFWKNNKRYFYVRVRELKQDGTHWRGHFQDPNIAMLKLPNIISNDEIIRYCIVKGLRDLGISVEIVITNARDEVYYPEGEPLEIDPSVGEKLELISLKKALNRDSPFTIRDNFPNY